MKGRFAGWLGRGRPANDADVDEGPLPAAQRDVQRRRRDGGADADALAGLASALGRLAFHLSAAGRQEDALDAIEEAIAILQQLTDADSDVYLPVMAAPEPGAFLDDLAMALRRRAVILRRQGRHDAAITPLQEAIAIHRRRMRSDPDVLPPGLADSLHELACRSASVERLPEALAAIEEAIAMRRELVGSDAGQFAKLALALDARGWLLWKADRSDDALAATQEAVVIRSRTAESEWDGPRDLATALAFLSEALRRVGRTDDAARAQAEAVSVLRDLVWTGGTALRPRLAPHDVDETVVMIRRLGEHDPDRHAALLAEAIELDDELQ